MVFGRCSPLRIGRCSVQVKKSLLDLNLEAFSRLQRLHLALNDTHNSPPRLAFATHLRATMLSWCSQYTTEQYSIVHYITEQYSTVHYMTEQNITVQYSTVRYSIVQYSTVQYRYSTAQHSTAQHSTAQHSTVQYSHFTCSKAPFSTSILLTVPS